MDLNKKLSSLHEISKAQLSKILTANPNRKHIVLEPTVIRPLERICGVKWLKGTGVEKIFKLEEKCPNFGNFPVFYMIFSQYRTFKQIVDQIRSQIDQENPPKNKYHIIVVPNFPVHFSEFLEQLGLLDNIIKLHAFQWLPLCLDTGLLSLETPHYFKTTYVEQTFNFLPSLSRTLWRLFFVVGRPKFALFLGPHANLISNQLDFLSEQKGDDDVLESDFGALLVIDRHLDYPSALLTPGTYTALLHEVYGVRAGVCEHKTAPVDDEPINTINKTPNKEAVSFSLDSNQDCIYADIKNRYFTEVTAFLSDATKQLKTENEKVQSREMGVEEMKKFVRNELQNTKTRKRLVSNHLLASETIISNLGARYVTQQEVELNILKNTAKSANLAYLEQLLLGEEDPRVVLRFFALISSTQRLADGETRAFWRKFLRYYGYRYGCVPGRMVSASLAPEAAAAGARLLRLPSLPKFGAGKEFYANAAKWRQIPANADRINVKFPTCPSYVFGGSYIPLIVQVCGALLNGTPLDELRMRLEGLGVAGIRNGGYPLERRAVLVVVVGGVTFAEVAACNFLEKMIGARIVVFSDMVVSGNDLMGDVIG